MTISRTKAIIFTLILSVTWLASVPSDLHAMLMPVKASVVSGSSDRAQDLQTIQTTLESKLLRAKLHALGLSDAEIQSRLSRLSDQQIHQMASQIRAVHPAGDFLIGILIVVLLVVVIIYLVKRI